VDLSADSVVEATRVSVVRNRAPILNDVDLAVARGETVAIMGRNGAGKSTLLGCLAGTLQPTCGSVVCFGDSPTRSAGAKRQIGFVGHRTGLYAELTARENLMFAARMYEVDGPSKRVHALLAEAGLEPINTRPVAELSQGVRRRLAILRAIVHQPRLILLDEPFVSLDADGCAWLEAYFQHWRDTGRTVCFASHQIEQGRRLADRTIWLEAGRIATIERLVSPNTHFCKSA